MASFYGRTGIQWTDDLSYNLELIAEVVRPAAKFAAESGAEIIREAAYNNANVSPGIHGHGIHGEHMRDEIRVNSEDWPNEVRAYISIDMSIIPYAAHQEFGPRGNAFMRRAMDENRDAAHEMIRSVFSAQLGLDGKIKTSVRFRRYA